MLEPLSSSHDQEQLLVRGQWVHGKPCTFRDYPEIVIFVYPASALLILYAHVSDFKIFP